MRIIIERLIEMFMMVFGSLVFGLIIGLIVCAVLTLDKMNSAYEEGKEAAVYGKSEEEAEEEDHCTL